MLYQYGYFIVFILVQKPTFLKKKKKKKPMVGGELNCFPETLGWFCGLPVKSAFVLHICE
jgi:hypothetical protein